MKLLSSKKLMVLACMVAIQACDRGDAQPAAAATPAAAAATQNGQPQVTTTVQIAGCNLPIPTGAARVGRSGDEIIVRWSEHNLEIGVKLVPFQANTAHSLAVGTRHRVRVTRSDGTTMTQYGSNGGSVSARTFDPATKTMIVSFENVTLSGGPGVSCTMTGNLEVGT